MAQPDSNPAQKSEHLRLLYFCSRLAAVSNCASGVTTFVPDNKMTDYAANVAMDSTLSTRPSAEDGALLPDYFLERREHGHLPTCMYSSSRFAADHPGGPALQFCPIDTRLRVSVRRRISAHIDQDTAAETDRLSQKRGTGPLITDMSSTKDPPDGGGDPDGGGGGGADRTAPETVVTTPTALNSPTVSQAVKAAGALLSFAATNAVFEMGEAPAKTSKTATRLKAAAKKDAERGHRSTQAGKVHQAQAQPKPGNAANARSSQTQQTRTATTTGTQLAKPGKPKRGKGAKAKQATPQQEAPAAVGETNIWANAREALLGEGKTTAPMYEDEIQYADAYKICRQDYRIMPDGYQRQPTKEEVQAEVLWRQRKIFLAQEPKFFTDIYPLKVRLALRQHQHDKMLYSVFVQMPAQVKWPAETARYHFFECLVRLNQPGANAADRANAVQLFKDVHVFTLSEDGKLVALRFVRPELRDKWINATFKFPFGTVKLRASESFEQDDKRGGLDEQAVKQLFLLQLLGRSNLPITTVNDIAHALGGGLPILEVVATPAIGDRTLETHVWSITYNSFDAPQGIENVRCVVVKQGDFSFKMGVHQPRAATRHPCSICLDVGHFRNKCTNQDKAAEMRDKFERVIEIPPTATYELEAPASDEVEHAAQVTRLYAAVAPQHAPPQFPTGAEPQENNASAANRQEESKSAKTTKTKQAKQTKQRKHHSDQVRALAKALAQVKELKAEARKAVVSKLTEKYGGKTESAKATGKTKAGATPVMTKPDPAQRWISVPGAQDVQTVVVGDKRMRAQLDPPQAIFEADTGADVCRERQSRSSATHTAIERKRPDAPRTRIQWEALGGELPPVSKPRFGQLTMTPFFTRDPLPKNPGTETSAKEGDEPVSGPVTLSELEEVGVKPGTPLVIRLPQILDTIQARQVQTCADGRCLYHALVAALSRTCGDAVNVTDSVEIKRATELMRDLNNLLADDMVAMLVNGSLQMVELCSRYLNGPVQHDSIQRLTTHFKTAAAQASPSVARQFWGRGSRDHCLRRVEARTGVLAGRLAQWRHFCTKIRPSRLSTCGQVHRLASSKTGHLDRTVLCPYRGIPQAQSCATYASPASLLRA